MKIQTPAGEEVEVAFGPTQAAHFVKVVQAGMVDRWPAANMPPLEFPILTLIGSLQGHGPNGPEVLAATEQIANVILSTSDKVLNDLKRTIDRVLDLRAARKAGLQ